MANVSVIMDIKYRVTQKNADGKEISQQFVNKTVNLGEMTEAQFDALHTVTDELETVADFHFD
jgi:hypothetical protein